MPRYEYVCTHCGVKFIRDLEVSKRDEPCNEECPRCSKMCIERPCRCSTFILKGHCWSKDNYTTHIGDDPNYKAGTWDATKGDE